MTLFCCISTVTACIAPLKINPRATKRVERDLLRLLWLNVRGLQRVRDRERERERERAAAGVHQKLRRHDWETPITLVKEL